MKIRNLQLRNFCGYEHLDLGFGDFNCLVGPNGIGKTTLLNAVSLMCSTLDFKGEGGAFADPNETLTAERRVKQILRKNIRNIDEPGGCTGFKVRALFEHNRDICEVVLTEKGWEKNELITKPYYWLGAAYFTKFDDQSANFQLRHALWDKFKMAWDEITGFPAVEPEVYTVDKLAKVETKPDYVIGFKMEKPGGNVHCRKGSAGERKIMKALTQIVNMEDERQPDIVLIDNIEMHIHYKRHLRAIEHLKKLFQGKQIISTTHSLQVINEYQPKEHIIDIEKILEARYGNPAN